MTCWPNGVCDTSGWYWTPQIRRAGDSSAATGAPADVAVATKSSGTRAMPSKWLIHTVCSAGWSASRPLAPSPVTVSAVRPYSPFPPRATSPPSCWAISWAP
jgi:hypothetical protein